MTFTELKTVVKDYCGLSSTDADTRVGKAINRHYRRVTSTLGLNASRFVTRSVAMTVGQQAVTFTDIEKIDRILDSTTATAIRLLDETSIHEIRSNQPGTGEPVRWALQNTDADSVTVLTDTVPTVAYSLSADGWTTLSDLSGSDEPVFPESFHDILAWFVIAEELLKKEKPGLAKEYQARAEQLLSDLRFHLADSPTHTTRQGGGTVSGVTGGGSGSAGNVGSSVYTQTGLITFDLDPSAPFAVASGSAKVANLDADLLDGLNSTAFGLVSGTLAQFAATTSAQLAGVLSDETGSGAAVFATSPTLVTPALGTPSAAVLTNATGLPIATGLSGLGAANRIPYATGATVLATSANLTYDGTNLTVLSGDIRTTAWTDYSATSTVTGWSSFTSKKIFYKRVGTTVRVTWMLAGTSNATSASFTLPFSNGADVDVYTKVPRAVDNGVFIGQTKSVDLLLTASNNTVTILVDNSTTGFTASGTKSLAGQFWYESA